QVLVVLLADDGGEQGLFGDVVALADAGAVAVHQARQQDLVEAHDELVVEDRPQPVVFEVGVHSWEGTRHWLSTPWVPFAARPPAYRFPGGRPSEMWAAVTPPGEGAL